jgi:hypothetical protein
MGEVHDPSGGSGEVLVLRRRLFRFLYEEQMPYFLEQVAAEPEIRAILREGDLYVMSVLHNETPYCLVLHLASMREELQTEIDDRAIQCGGLRIDEGEVVQELTHYATLRYLSKPSGGRGNIASPGSSSIN